MPKGAVNVKHKGITMQDMAEKKTRQIVFRTTDEIADALDRLANQEDRTVAWMVNRALADWLAWRNEGGYDQPSGTMKSEGLEILRFWAASGPSQRKILRDMMNSGALSVREDDLPPSKLNESETQGAGTEARLIEAQLDPESRATWLEAGRELIGRVPAAPGEPAPAPPDRPRTAGAGEE